MYHCPNRGSIFLFWAVPEYDAPSDGVEQCKVGSFREQIREVDWSARNICRATNLEGRVESKKWHLSPNSFRAQL